MDRKTKQTINTVEMTGGHLSSQEREKAGVSYLFLMSFVMLLSEKDSLFVRLHAFIGATLCLAMIVVWYLPLITILHYGLIIILLLLMMRGSMLAVQGRIDTIPYLSSQLYLYLLHSTSVPKIAQDEFAKQVLANREGVSQVRDVGMWSYVWFAQLFVAQYHSDNALLLMHARQGIVLFFLSVLCLLIPWGWYIVVFLIIPLHIAGMIYASLGHPLQIPGVYQLAQLIDSKRPVPPAVTLGVDKKSTEQVFYAILSYLGLGPLCLILKWKDSFIRFHALVGMIYLLLVLLASQAPSIFIPALLTVMYLCVFGIIMSLQSSRALPFFFTYTFSRFSHRQS